MSVRKFKVSGVNLFWQNSSIPFNYLTEEYHTMDKGKIIVFISDHVELITDETVGLLKLVIVLFASGVSLGKCSFCFMAVYTDTNRSLSTGCKHNKKHEIYKASYFHYVG